MSYLTFCGTAKSAPRKCVHHPKRNALEGCGTVPLCLDCYSPEYRNLRRAGWFACLLLALSTPNV